MGKQKKFLERNVGNVDRIVRGALGILLLAVYAFGAFAAPINYVLLAIGIIAILTCISGWCGVYSTLKISTFKEGAAKPKNK